MNTSIFDSNAPFDAAVFFKGLRNIGLGSYVAESGLTFNFPLGLDDRYETLCRWAVRKDVGGSAQMEYAVERWHARSDGQRVVHLG